MTFTVRGVVNGPPRIKQPVKLKPKPKFDLYEYIAVSLISLFIGFTLGAWVIAIASIQ